MRYDIAMNPPNKEITLSLKLFSQLWLGWKEFAVTDNIENIIDKIKALDPNEEILHVEGPIKCEDTRTLNLTVRTMYKVWDVKYWKEEYARQLLVKAESERTAVLSIKRQEDIKRLVEAIRAKMSLDEPMALNMAKALYANKQKVVIEMLLGEKIEPIDDKEFYMKKI